MSTPTQQLRARLQVGQSVAETRIAATNKKDSREHARLVADHVTEQLTTLGSWIEERLEARD